MKQILGTLVLLCLTSAVWADRALYTSELVEGATIIGVWRAEDVKSRGDSVQLKRPDTVLKGEAKGITNVKQYSSRLTAAMQRIKKEGPFILFIRVDAEKADLVGDSGRLHYNSITLKAVKATISQIELKDKWKTLTVDEQIERSDLIVSGRIPAGPESKRVYTISPDKIYRGIPPKRLSVLPVPKGQLDTKALFLIQRHSGSGPDYIVMNAIPLKEAKEYLTKLKEHGSIPTKKSDAHPKGVMDAIATLLMNEGRWPSPMPAPQKQAFDLLRKYDKGEEGFGEHVSDGSYNKTYYYKKCNITYIFNVDSDGKISRHFISLPPKSDAHPKDVMDAIATLLMNEGRWPSPIPTPQKQAFDLLRIYDKPVEGLGMRLTDGSHNMTHYLKKCNITWYFNQDSDGKISHQFSVTNAVE